MLSDDISCHVKLLVTALIVFVIIAATINVCTISTEEMQKVVDANNVVQEDSTIANQVEPINDEPAAVIDNSVSVVASKDVVVNNTTVVGDNNVIENNYYTSNEEAKGTFLDGIAVEIISSIIGTFILFIFGKMFQVFKRRKAKKSINLNL